jgi:chromosome segregation ATPase
MRALQMRLTARLKEETVALQAERGAAAALRARVESSALDAARLRETIAGREAEEVAHQAQLQRKDAAVRLLRAKADAAAKELISLREANVSLTEALRRMKDVRARLEASLARAQQDLSAAQQQLAAEAAAASAARASWERDAQGAEERARATDARCAELLEAVDAARAAAESARRDEAELRSANLLGLHSLQSAVGGAVASLLFQTARIHARVVRAVTAAQVEAVDEENVAGGLHSAVVARALADSGFSAADVESLLAGSKDDRAFPLATQQQLAKSLAQLRAAIGTPANLTLLSAVISDAVEVRQAAPPHTHTHVWLVPFSHSPCARTRRLSSRSLQARVSLDRMSRNDT